MFMRAFLSAFVVVWTLVASPAHSAGYGADFFFDIADYPSRSVMQPLDASVYKLEIGGSLAARSQIVFSYVLTNAIVYENNPIPLPFMMNIAETGGYPLAFVGAGESTSASDAFTLVMASLQSDGASGTGIFKNFSDDAITISSLLYAPFAEGGEYRATWEVSAIPLPAALPLFGLGLASLAGFSTVKRRKA